MTVYDVWFWAPFHMLQAYPITRNLPLPDVFIPFAHLIWVPMYIWEHWTGLAEPVEEAWAMKSIVLPLSLILILSFFYITHQMSDKPTVVKVGAAMYFAFMFFATDLGFQGSPKKTYEEQIEANADSSWNNQHLILHIYYLVILWVVALTVPYHKLAAKRAAGVGTGLNASDPSNTESPGLSITDVFKEAIYGEKLLPEFSTIRQTSKFLILQGIIYSSSGMLMFFLPGDEETALYPGMGFCVIGIGYFYIMASRMNNNYWAVATIFTRMIMTPVGCMTLWAFFGVPAQVCVSFGILDPTLAFLTYLSLKQDEQNQGTYATIA